MSLKTGAAKGSVYRILRTMVAYGYVGRFGTGELVLSGKKELPRAESRIEQIKNRPLRVWEMRMVAASAMKHLEKITNTIVVPDFTPVDLSGEQTHEC